MTSFRKLRKSVWCERRTSLVIPHKHPHPRRSSDPALNKKRFQHSFAEHAHIQHSRRIVTLSTVLSRWDSCIAAKKKNLIPAWAVWNQISYLSLWPIIVAGKLLLKCWTRLHNSAGSAVRMTNWCRDWHHRFVCLNITDLSGDVCSRVLIQELSASEKFAFFFFLPKIKCIIPRRQGLSNFKGRSPNVAERCSLVRLDLKDTSFQYAAIHFSSASCFPVHQGGSSISRRVLFTRYMVANAQFYAQDNLTMYPFPVSSRAAFSRAMFQYCPD